MKLKLPLLGSFDNFLLETQKLEDVQRWKKYHENNDARKENSLHHSYNSIYIAIKIIKNEKKFSQKSIDSNLIYESIYHHDLGEIKIGDTLYHNKTEQKDKAEYNYFLELLNFLPKEFREQADIAYNLQNIGKKGFEKITQKLENKFGLEAKLFEAIERYGYLVFAYGEYLRDNQERLFNHVLRHQHPHLVRLANELPGFKQTFYTPKIQNTIEEFIKQNKENYLELP